MYEKAIHFFERASQIQPDEVKWRLMVTSCYRRMQNLHKALELYEKIHTEHPENLECLRYLVAICKDLGRPHDVYQQKLSRLDRMPQAQTGRGALTRVGGDSGGRAARPMGGALGRVQEDEDDRRTSKSSPMHAPMARGDLGSTPKKGGKNEEEEDFADTDVGDLLPGM